MTSILLSLCLSLVPCSDPPDASWPSFRGFQARGVSDGHPLPESWNVETGEGIRWSVTLPGLAHSSPIAWRERLYVLAAVRLDGDSELKIGLYGSGDSVPEEGEHSFRLLAIDRETGARLFERELHRGVPRLKRHPKATHANATPATNGEVVVTFLGSEGLYCHTMDGELRWRRDLGFLDVGAPGYDDPQYQWGFASSPVIHGDRILIQCDQQQGSYLAALDLESGETVWKTERDELPTWGTPTVVMQGKEPQVVANGYQRIGGYALEDGQPLWWMHGGGDVPVPTPIVWNGLIFITNAHGRQSPIYAIPVDARGELDPDPESGHLAWSETRRGNYMQTPLVYRDLLYLCHDTGVLSCYRPATGELLYRERLGEGRAGWTASPVAGDGKIYVTSEEGEVHIVRAGETFDVVGVHSLGESCLATPAIVRGALYFRTRTQLIAVGR
ncbi:MAG: PQQ-binding-like beta-propeller repeat protein [Planctomycetota bacterium]